MGTDACIEQTGKLTFLQKQNYKTIITFMVKLYLFCTSCEAMNQTWAFCYTLCILNRQNF